MNEIELQHVLHAFEKSNLKERKRILGKFVHTFTDTITVGDITDDQDLQEQLHNLMDLRISLVTIPYHANEED